MKGLDDGPDGLNEDAFDRALRRLPGVRRVSRRGKALVIHTGPATVHTEELPCFVPASPDEWIVKMQVVKP